MTEKTTRPSNALFICTRPRLTSYLLENGFVCTVQANPFRPGLKCWQFTVNHDLAWLVSEYYRTEVGKPAPAVIQNELKKEVNENA